MKAEMPGITWGTKVFTCSLAEIRECEVAIGISDMIAFPCHITITSRNFSKDMK